MTLTLSNAKGTRAPLTALGLVLAIMGIGIAHGLTFFDNRALRAGSFVVVFFVLVVAALRLDTATQAMAGMPGTDRPYVRMIVLGEVAPWLRAAFAIGAALFALSALAGRRRSDSSSL